MNMEQEQTRTGEAAAARAGETLAAIVDNICSVIIGKRPVVELVVLSLVAGGHVLIEDVPGVGKTSLVSALAKSVSCAFQRIQFTPDIMPSDVTGFSIYNQKTGEFEFRPGAVMSNLILADEINRASAKTQASLLEAMEEKQVTVDSKTYPLEEPFMVLATQNPVESYGTFPLPEAQLDRFFMRLSLGYMTREQEMEVVSRPSTADILNSLEPVVSPEVIQEMKELYTKVRVQKDVLGYMMDIVEKTRTESRFVTGVSTRGAIALYKASQAMAASLGRDFVIPEDVKAAAPWVLSHRIISRGGESFEDARKYLGQMDLNIKSPLVWEFYDETLKTLAAYGAKIVRLDAFAYAPKEPGEKNFLNEPGTWEVLEKVRKLADKYNLTLLPEIHASYGEKNYEQIAKQGYMTYDFFLPGMIIDALESGNGSTLEKWAKELMEKEIHVVNMLGCHDGIPLLDLKGLIPEERIQQIIDTVVARGGYVKDLHGQKNVYYQVNATYYSALGEDDKKMLMARALQMFMPGKPQVWYLDLFAGKNDHEAVKRAGAGGHKEINRTNLSAAQIEELMKTDIVKEQLKLLHFRNVSKAFGFDAELAVSTEGEIITFIWTNQGESATLRANLKTFEYEITDSEGIYA